MTTEGKTILVAESNASLANMVRSGLEKAGFAVVVAEDGRDAWDKLENSAIDLVVTDYSMRDSIGTEICRVIRQQKKYANLPIIVTASAGETDLTQLQQELNLAATFKKPFSVKELVATTEQHFAG